jgi:hypothetical protein
MLGQPSPFLYLCPGRHLRVEFSLANADLYRASVESLRDGLILGTTR